MATGIEFRLSHQAAIKAYWALGKPRVVAVMLVCMLVGLLLARPQMPGARLLLISLLGVGLVAMGAAAFNHILDQRFDRLMARTQKRPLVRQCIAVNHACWYAVMLTLSGLLLLATEVNILTAGLTALAMVGYAVVYTAFLKHATPQNITIGGLAGAAPPLLGWTAVTNQVEADAILLVLIIFAWTPAHFWALAIYRCEEYRKAGVPMLPVTHGMAFTRLQVWLYSWLTVAATFMPYVSGMSGEVYLLGMCLVNFRWLKINGGLWLSSGDKMQRQAKKSFWFSIRYILYCFLFLLVDRVIHQLY